MPENIFDQRRFGRFRIDERLLREEPGFLMEQVFSKCVVWDVQRDLSGPFIVYWAASLCFDKLEHGYGTPEYELEIVSHETIDAAGDRRSILRYAKFHRSSNGSNK